MKISTRLSLLFLLVASLPLALFSYFNLRQDEVTLRDEALGRLSDLADKKVIQIRSFLDEREREAGNRARSPYLSRAFGDVQSAYAAGRNTRDYVAKDTELRRYFERYVDESGMFYDVFLISLQGEIIYTQKHESDFATNLLAGPYRETQLAQVFRSVRMTLKPVISGYADYAPSQTPALFIAAPVMTDGRLVGIFAAQLDNSLFYRVATDATGLGVSGEAVFAQRDGDGVLYTLPLKYQPDAAMKYRLAGTDGKAAQMFVATNGGSGSGIRTDYRNKSVASAWRYLPELDWGVVVKVDADEVFDSIYRQRALMIEVQLGLFVLAGLVAFYFWRQINVPLARLAWVAGEVSAGNLAKRADESTPGELGVFARAFNRMTENLQSLYHSLEERVEERTRELNVSNEQLQEEIVEREHIEESLQHSMDRIRMLMNAVAEGIYGVDAQGNCIFMNAAGLHMLGYRDESELVGKYIHDLIHHTRPDGSHYPGEECRLYRCLGSREAIHVDDEWFWRKDGSSFPVDYWSRPMEHDGEKGAVVTFMDVSEQRRAKIELERNQNLLNEAQRLGRLGSWELNLVSGELRWSDEVFRLFELDPARFKPSYENFLNAIHPDDRDKVSRAYTQSLEDRQPYDVEHRLQMADGRVKWVRERCTSDFDADGKPLRSAGAVQDITEQKLVENKLRVEAAVFEAQECIMVTDSQPVILRVNKAFERVTGYSAEEALGKNPNLLSSGRQDKEFYVEMWRQLLDEGKWAGEIWDKRKNGEIYPKWLTLSAVKDSSGKTTEYVAIFTDITERKRAEEEIHNLAFFDALTGLPNRRLLQDRFQTALLLSERSHHCGALMFLDMDKFKTLNDTLGHDIGDRMLVEVGRRIRGCVREADTVARLGGDEFVVLVEEIGANMNEASRRVAALAEKIRTALAQPYDLGGHEFYSSPSIGVSMYRGSAESVDTLMKQADLAMYQAKDAGRNAVRFFDPLMQHTVEARAEIESDLRGAVPNKQMNLYYQIQVDSERRPIGAEALIRWMHPRRGMVSPAQFIPIAEESGLILGIGLWVIETACAQLAEWAHDAQMRHIVLAINVSAQQFRQANFVEQLQEVVIRYGIQREHLKLELTESVVLEDVADVVGKMHALKALGVRLSLDDFGTGYSSLAYLKQLPLDQLKIDQSFVRDITSDRNDAVMVKTIIDMAQNFSLNVIAEGVETDAQLAFLRLNNCMAYQGYLFSKPVPLAEFEALARSMFG